MTEKSWENAAIETRETRAFIEAAARVYRGEKQPDWFVELSLSTRWHRVVLHFERSRDSPSPHFPRIPSILRFCPGEFQKRYFMRSLFNPPIHSSSRVYMYIDNARDSVFVRYRVTRWWHTKLSRDRIRRLRWYVCARARACARFYFKCVYNGYCVLRRVTTGGCAHSRHVFTR